MSANQVIIQMDNEGSVKITHLTGKGVRHETFIQLMDVCIYVSFIFPGH